MLFLFLGGLVLTASGGYGVRQDRRLTRTGQQVPGTVVGLRTPAGRATWLPYLITAAGLAVLGYAVFKAAHGSCRPAAG